MPGGWGGGRARGRGGGGGAATSRWVRSLRPPKRPVDALRPLGHSWEEERTADDGVLPVLTIFLAGAECPFSCVFCDLWQHTLDGSTPLGAIPQQIDVALAEAGPLPARAMVKLYNASTFFDVRAVPPEDDTAIAELLEPFRRVTVECHPRLLARRCLEFADQLAGRLEVAIGLETIHPDALPRLNKGVTLEQFDRAATFVTEANISLRSFVLVSPPFVPAGEAVEWAVRSARYAIERGARHVSFIPVRGGNGALDELRRTGQWTPPTLEHLEEEVERALELDGVVTADLWDADELGTCRCGPVRVARLARMNLTGEIQLREACAECGWN